MQNASNAQLYNIQLMNTVTENILCALHVFYTFPNNNNKIKIIPELNNKYKYRTGIMEQAPQYS